MADQTGESVLKDEERYTRGGKAYCRTNGDGEPEERKAYSYDTLAGYTN